MSFTTHYAVFAALAIAAFPMMRPAISVAVICLVGWLLLPIGTLAYAPSDWTFFTFWITGVGLPGYTLVSKFWVAPVAALAASIIWDRAAWRTFRPIQFDGIIVALCMWPLVQGLIVPRVDPPAWIASLYLAGSWGACWLLARLYFHDRAGQCVLLASLALSALVLLPIAIVETTRPAWLYGWWYHLHPFRVDGVTRAWGYRPIGFFEHGTQYALWASASALAAIGWWRHKVRSPGRGILVALSVGLALLSQSGGAIALLCLALPLVLLPKISWLRIPIFAALVLLALGSTIFVTGIGPDWRAETPIARQARDAAAKVIPAERLGTLRWRMGRDLAARRIIATRPWVGAGTPNGWGTTQRPWSFTLSAVGQYGLTGLILLFATLLLPALWALSRRQSYQRGDVSFAVAAIVLVGAADMLFNSFILYPAILAAGALAGGFARPRVVADGGDEHA